MAVVTMAGRAPRSVHTASGVIHEWERLVDELGTNLGGKPLSVGETEPQHRLGAAPESTAAELASPARGRAA